MNKKRQDKYSDKEKKIFDQIIYEEELRKLLDEGQIDRFCQVP